MIPGPWQSHSNLEVVLPGNPQLSHGMSPVTMTSWLFHVASLTCKGLQIKQGTHFSPRSSAGPVGPPNKLQISNESLAHVQVIVSIFLLLPVSVQATPAAINDMLASAHTVSAYSYANHIAAVLLSCLLSRSQSH